MLIPRGNESFGELLHVLRKGDPVIMACDTIYGFVGIVPESEERIRRIKGRGESKQFLQLIASAGDLPALGFEKPSEDFFNLWPGPFTYVLSGKEGRTGAFRVPCDERLRQLIVEVGKPLYSTSVNRAGSPPMENPADMEDEFGAEVSIVEDSGLFDGRKPSTIVNLSERPYRILRQGAGIVPLEFLN